MQTLQTDVMSLNNSTPQVQEGEWSSVWSQVPCVVQGWQWLARGTGQDQEDEVHATQTTGRGNH